MVELVASDLLCAERLTSPSSLERSVRTSRMVARATRTSHPRAEVAHENTHLDTPGVVREVSEIRSWPRGTRDLRLFA